MKKYTNLIFLILLFTNIYCEESACGLKNPASSIKDCKDLKVSDSYKYCCYLDATTNEGNLKFCYEIKESDYKEIDKFKKNLEKDSDGKVNSLDCNSYYLNIGLLSLMVLFF